MMADDRRARRSEAFFGRRRGKAIRPSQIDALQQGLARHGIDIRDGAPSPLSELFTASVDSIRLEIGFGGGEHLHHRATTELATGFIGVEPFVNGMAKMMAVMERSPSANVRVFDDDATLLLDWLPPASLDGIDLLYPDPWPKKKHWKRRFVGNTNLDRFARVLKSGGKFRFASDIDSYINWTLLHCRAHDAFHWDARDADDWRRPYPGWPGTRYEAKAIREGREPAYLTFTRS